MNARIFAVADAFDAITSDRVYRKGRPYEAALAELEEWACRQFDPRVVEAFRRVPPQEWDELRRQSWGLSNDGPEVQRAAAAEAQKASAPSAPEVRGRLKSGRQSAYALQLT